jgi:hypothetical protein
VPLPSTKWAKQTLKQRLGNVPLDDSLAAISWMQRALARWRRRAREQPHRAEKREELLKIADRMAKLRDPDRIYQAERIAARREESDRRAAPGPQLKDAPTSTERSSVAARRGRPPKRSLL